MNPIIDLTHMRRSPTITAAVTPDNDALVFSVAFQAVIKDGPPPDNALHAVDAPFQLPEGSEAKGISFEVRGDGSDTCVSVMLAYDSTNNVALGFEAIFFLESTEWTRLTLRWHDFVQNHLAWDPECARDDSTLRIDPARIRLIGFGLGNYLNGHYPAHANFQIRNFRLADQLPEQPPRSSFSEGWSRTSSVIEQRSEPLRILLIGDSITSMGGDESYGYFLGQHITRTWGVACEVANCGVGGHSVRGGTIVLPRSLRTMPVPDLACIFFGANDVKALGLKPGFGEEAFRMQLEDLIEKVRSGTRGMADICLVSGVPRLLPDSTVSAGTIEQIVNGVRAAASNKKAAFVDTFATYLHLSPEEKQTYYMDTVHQTPAGRQYLGCLVFEALRAEIAR